MTPPKQPSDEALNRRLEAAESALAALRKGQVDTVMGENQTLVVRLAQTEAALVASEELFRTVFEQAAVGTAQLLPNGRIVRSNARYSEILGYTPDQLRRISLKQITHPEDFALDRESIGRVFDQGTDTFEAEKRFIHRDGAIVWAQFFSRAIRHEDGSIKYVIASIIDITERKRAEEALRRRERQLQQIFDILPIGLWSADKDGTLLRGNPAGVRIWGAEPRVTMSEYGVFKAWRLPGHEPIAADDCALAKTIRDGATIVDEMLEIEAFDGKRKTILNYTAPILDGDGRIDGAIVVNLDITDRTLLEAQLLQAQKMESVGRLAGGVAHDFNNMLGVILGYAELALDKVAEKDPLHADLNEIITAARRSADITRQLLAFARRQTIAPKVLDLNDTVEGMLRVLRRLIGEDIDLQWLPDGGLWPVNIDPSQVDQILANLCVNARDAIHGVGKITIETENVHFDPQYCRDHIGFTAGDYVLLAVSDDGCGMDAEIRGHLFEPFFTTKDAGQGTGLGLATVYGIVRQNNGFINVYSEPGGGTTFKIYLPRHTEAIETLPAVLKLENKTGRGETILVVEDEAAVLKLACAILEGLGYNVLAAAIPAEAEKMAGKHDGRIDLLITDVVMPQMNGRQLAARIQALYPGLRTLFMSGYTANVIAHHGVLEDGVHFIQKPFSRQDLAARVREALG
jgi:two-component system, cell cycle sensor histidine kinase and response regulator CckA